MTSSSWNDLRINNEVCDGVIKTPDGSKFSIHRVILSGFSPYFRASFTNTLNKGEPEITELMMTDIQPSILGCIIEFAYTGSCTIDEDNVHDLVIAADRLVCDPIVKRCSVFIANHLSVTNCISNWRFVKTFFCGDLEMKVWQFICDHADRLAHSSELLTLTAAELEELLSADELNVGQEEDVFNIISRWVEEDPDARKSCLVQLMRCIRYGLINISYYVEVIRQFQHHSEESLTLIQTLYALFENEEELRCFRYSCSRPRIPNEVIFAFGGWSEGSPTDLVETYDKRSDNWYLTGIRDQKVRAYHGVQELDMKIYIVGGFDGSEYFSTLHCFDPITYKWTEKACMHEIRCYVSLCQYGGEIYAIGGFNGRSRLKTAEKYNPANNQWTMISPMNKNRSDASAAAFNERIYVVGGFNGSEVMSSVEVYKVSSGMWDYVDAMSSPRSGVSLINYGNYLYAFGGFDGVSRLKTVERYNPYYNRWDLMSDMQLARSNMASVVVDNNIFIMGGFNGQTTISQCEKYDVVNDRWHEAADLNLNRSALAVCKCKALPNAKDYTFIGVNDRSTGRSGNGDELGN